MTTQFTIDTTVFHGFFTQSDTVFITALIAGILPSDVRGFERSYTDKSKVWVYPKQTDKAEQQFIDLYNKTVQQLAWFASGGKDGTQYSAEIRGMAQYRLDNKKALAEYYGKVLPRVNEIQASADKRTAMQSAKSSDSGMSASKANTALANLMTKFANGEITKSEYDEMKRTISASVGNVEPTKPSEPQTENPFEQTEKAEFNPLGKIQQAQSVRDSAVQPKSTIRTPEHTFKGITVRPGKDGSKKYRVNLENTQLSEMPRYGETFTNVAILNVRNTKETLASGNFKVTSANEDGFTLQSI